MTLVVLGVTLLLYGTAVVLLSPGVLDAARWSIDQPRVTIALWKSAVLSGAISLVFGIITVGVGIGIPPPPPSPRPVGLIDLAYSAVALAVLVTLAVLFRPRATSDQRALEKAVRASDEMGLGDVSDPALHVHLINAAAPLACAVPGRGHRVLVTSGLAAQLTDAELTAVIEHEVAHIRQAHARAIRIAYRMRRLLPWLPATRTMLSSMRMLSELAADDAAVRVVGRDTVESALRKSAATSELAELRADRLERQRAERRASTPLGYAAIVTLPGIPALLALVGVAAYWLRF